MMQNDAFKWCEALSEIGPKCKTFGHPDSITKFLKNIDYEGIIEKGFRSFSVAPKSKMLHL